MYLYTFVTFHRQNKTRNGRNARDRVAKNLTSDSMVSPSLEHDIENVILFGSINFILSEHIHIDINVTKMDCKGNKNNQFYRYYWES
ncbi:hypothetical protein HZH66_013704 [Vespula vulgaris]|uniref:Uncharacterized protein n=1 Tax=Vespula vulgaris TaxID=7454 RepID=A0A834J808_VESVU|nr:hypothetical protein HZH66_013704 [Vespula vulgaris]